MMRELYPRIHKQYREVIEAYNKAIGLYAAGRKTEFTQAIKIAEQKRKAIVNR